MTFSYILYISMKFVSYIIFNISNCIWVHSNYSKTFLNYFDLGEGGWHAYIYYEAGENDQTHVKNIFHTKIVAKFKRTSFRPTPLSSFWRCSLWKLDNGVSRKLGFLNLATILVRMCIHCIAGVDAKYFSTPLSACTQ